MMSGGFVEKMAKLTVTFNRLIFCHTGTCKEAQESFCEELRSESTFLEVLDVDEVFLEQFVDSNDNVKAIGLLQLGRQRPYCCRYSETVDTPISAKMRVRQRPVYRSSQPGLMFENPQMGFKSVQKRLKIRKNAKANDFEAIDRSRTLRDKNTKCRQSAKVAHSFTTNAFALLSD